MTELTEGDRLRLEKAAAKRARRGERSNAVNRKVPVRLLDEKAQQRFLDRRARKMLKRKK